MDRISIIRGRAAGVEVALASDAVLRMVDDHEELVNLAALLDAASTPVPKVGECRALVLSAPPYGRAEVRMGEPVRFDTLTSRCLLADAPVLPARCIPYTVGFASLRGELVLLLDARRIVAAVAAIEADRKARLAKEIP